MPDAAALAARNAERLAITNVSVLQSHWFSALAGQRFAMIVSNPPYIDEADPHLEQGDVRFEPKRRWLPPITVWPTSRISSGKDAVS